MDHLALSQNSSTSSYPNPQNKKTLCDFLFQTFCELGKQQLSTERTLVISGGFEEGGGSCQSNKVILKMLLALHQTKRKLILGNTSKLFLCTSFFNCMKYLQFSCAMNFRLLLHATFAANSHPGYIIQTPMCQSSACTTSQISDVVRCSSRLA